MARKPSKLTEKQETYVDEVMKGSTKAAAAKKAGYAQPQLPELSEKVKEEIAAARAELTDLTKIDRLMVINGIMDGISCARMQADAGNIIKGWTEVAKILGHYAPEVKTIDLTQDSKRLLAKFEALSDAELLAIQNGGVVDVEAKRIN